MPRCSREKSKTGIYHIVVRGINRQELFYENEDRGLFMQKLMKYKEECKFELYGYCLMDNHIHLVIKEYEIPISTIMSKLNTAYVHWYNLKYERCGHLFQNRYMSEAVEDDSYLVTVIRYIHQNPIKSGMVTEMSNFEWSSYNRYIDKMNNIVDSKMITEMLGGINGFKIHMNEISEQKCIDIDTAARMRDNEVIEYIKKIGNVKSPLDLQNMDRMNRNKIIVELKLTAGISFRQIERITGIGRGAIEKAR